MASAAETGAPVEERSWVDESLSRYGNPRRFFGGGGGPSAPARKLVEERVLDEGTENCQLRVYLSKEYAFWHKFTLDFEFAKADVEGEGEKTVFTLVFDSWRSELTVKEDGEVKYEELQKPFIGGTWTAETKFGQVIAKITPGFLNNEYTLDMGALCHTPQAYIVLDSGFCSRIGTGG